MDFLRSIDLTTLDNRKRNRPTLLQRLSRAADKPLKYMGTRPRRQQTTEKIGDPLNLGIGIVQIERRNGSPILSARTFIQGKHKLWSTGERTEKDARRVATEQFLALHQRIGKGEQLHGRFFSDLAEKFLAHVDEHQQGEISAGQRKNYREKWTSAEAAFYGSQDCQPRYAVSACAPREAFTRRHETGKTRPSRTRTRRRETSRASWQSRVGRSRPHGMA